MLNNRWHYIIQMVLLLPILGCLESICLFTVHRLCPFSHSLGSIPLKCVYLCNLAHISSMLETNSNRMLSFSLLKESQKVHLLLSVFSKVINSWWGNLWVLTRQCYLQENAARSSGFLSCWHCQSDMYGGSVSVSCNYPLVSPQLLTRPVPHWAPMVVLPPLVLPGWGWKPKVLLWVTES